MSIQNDLQELASKGLISAEQVVHIREYYQNHKKSGSNTLTMIFGGIGAVLIGLAVILILAHNWDQMHVYTKLAVAFFPLVLAQILTVFTLMRKNDSQTWREVSAITLFFSIGACMALIAQIYHINDTGGTFFLTWAALSLPVIYILRSFSISILSILVITFFNMNYAFSRDAGDYRFIYYYLYMMAILPYYILLIKHHPQSNATYIHHWVVALSLMICTAAISFDKMGYVLFMVYMALFTFYFNLGKSSHLYKTPSLANAYVVISQLGISIILLILSFSDVWTGIARDYDTEQMIFSKPFILVVIYTVAGMYLYTSNQPFRPVHFLHFFLVIVPFAVIFYLNDTYPEILINVLTLGLGVHVVIRGITEEKLASLNLGLMIISFLILCRFFDTDMSYLIRGLVFAGLGLGFFLTNYFMIRKFNRNEK